MRRSRSSFGRARKDVLASRRGRRRRNRGGRGGSFRRRRRRRVRSSVPTDPEQDELIRVTLQLVRRDLETEIVQEEELELELVQFVQRQSTDLERESGARVSMNLANDLDG